MTITEALNIILSIFRQYRDRHVLILTHSSADVDAFASVVVFSEFLRDFFSISNISLFVPSFSKYTQEFINKFQNNYSVSVRNFQKFPDKHLDIIVIIDTNNVQQIDLPLDKKDSLSDYPILIIDHHFSPNSNLESKVNKIIDESFTSSSELIYELIKRSAYSLTRRQNILLLSGMLSDTGFLRYANNSTYFVISEILKNDINIQDVYVLLQIEEEISAKIAKIRGLQRVKLYRLNDDILLGVAKVGSFESKVATNLISSGFDIAIVYSHDKAEFNITGRAKNYLLESKELHLGQLFNAITLETRIKSGDQKDGELNAGGHAGAASIKGIGDVKKTLIKVIKSLELQVSGRIQNYSKI